MQILSYFFDCNHVPNMFFPNLVAEIRFESLSSLSHFPLPKLHLSSSCGLWIESRPPSILKMVILKRDECYFNTFKKTSSFFFPHKILTQLSSFKLQMEF